MIEEAIMRFTSRDGNSYTHTFLSNFYAEPFVCGLLGEVKTAEHAYQAYKCRIVSDRLVVLNASSPAQAKKVGRMVELRPDWEAVKFIMMRAVLAAKFEHETELAQKLLVTGDALLVEGNDWGDRTWGVVDGVGENWLGHLLMARRAELRYAPWN